MIDPIVAAVVLAAFDRELKKGEGATKSLQALLSDAEMAAVVDQASTLRAIAQHVEEQSTPAAVKARAAAKAEAARKVQVEVVPGLGPVRRGDSAHLERMEKTLDVRHAQERVAKARLAAADAERAARAATDKARGATGTAREQLENAAHNGELLAKSAIDQLRTAEAELEQLRKLTT